MKSRYASLILIASVLVACGGSAHDRMQGTWVLDTDALKQMDEYKNADPGEKAMMDMVIGGATMEVEIKADTMIMHMEMMGQKNSQTTKYVVKSQTADSVTIETDESGKKETSTCTVDGDSLKVKVRKMTLALKRK